MAIINRLILIVCVFFFLACSESSSLPAFEKTLSNRDLDSLGDLAYDHFSAYENDPEGFLSPIHAEFLKEDQKEAYLWILINMAYGFQQNSQIFQSTAYYEKAWKYENEENLLEKEDKLTYLFKPLANNYTVLSDYGKAERLHLQAFNESEKSLEKASYSNNLTILYTHKGDLSQAVEYGNAGLKYAQDSVHLQVLIHNALSNAYVYKESLDSAKLHNEWALEKSSKIKNEWDAAAKISALNQKSHLELLKGNQSLALFFLQNSLELENRYFPQTRFREKASIFNKVGELEVLKMDNNKAIDLFKTALSYYNRENLKEYTSTYTKVLILKNLGFAYGSQNVDSAWMNLKSAVEADFSFQQGVTTQESHLLNNVHNRRLLEEVFDFAQQMEPSVASQFSHELLWMTEMTKGRLLWNDVNRSQYWASSPVEMQESLDVLKSLYTQRDKQDKTSPEIQEKIAKVLADFELQEQYFTRNVPLPDFDKFQSSFLDSDILQYAYFIHSDSTLSIFKIWKGDVKYTYVQEKGILESLNQFKKRYFSDSPHAFNTNPAGFYTESERLRKILLPDLEETASQLKLSLDNELFMIPFDALTLEQQFLINKWDIQHVHSFIMDNHLSFEQNPIQILYRENYEQPLSNLQFVKNEINSIKNEFFTDVVRPGKVTAESIQQAFEQKSVVHIAAHAILNEQTESFLMLDFPVSTDQLRYYNIQAPLVVLSACNTASGEILLSEGLASMNRAFLSKGVQGVIATHWFANDDVMLDLTSRFYTFLNVSQNPVFSLSEAKRQYLSEQNEWGKNPWYWSNMSYTGSSIQIDLPQRTGLSRLGIREFLFAIVLISSSVLFFRKSIRKSIR